MYRDRFDFDGDFDFDEPAPELDGRPRRLDDHVEAGAYEQLVETCIADIDGDAQVHFDELLILLAAFGPCNPDGSPAPEGIADCIARIGFNDPEKLAACIEAMTMAGTP